MKVAELRALLEKYSDQQLRVIIAEMYKAIPKAVKEDKEIDSILTNPRDLLERKPPEKKKEPLPDMDELEYETSQFIEYAYQQYYFAPNSYVPKKQRPQWRFVARRLYKSLVAAAAANAEDLPLASELLTKLYVMLCYSCEYVLFSAYDSFESVGIEQATFFRSVLDLKYRHESPDEFVNNSIILIVDHSLNRYTLYSTLMEIAIHYISDLNFIEMALTTCDRIIAETRKEPETKKKGWTDTNDYRKNRKLNNLVEMKFLCYAELQEFEEGIEYFEKNYLEQNLEVKLYILLHLLFLFQQKELFIQIYQKALKQQVKPRERLVKFYETLQSTGEFPEYFC
jgi:hypothetical protein